MTRKRNPIESDGAGLARFLERSDGTSTLLDRLQRNLKLTADPERRKRLGDAIEFTKEAA